MNPFSAELRRTAAGSVPDAVDPQSDIAERAATLDLRVEQRLRGGAVRDELDRAYLRARSTASTGANKAHPSWSARPRAAFEATVTSQPPVCRDAASSYAEGVVDGALVTLDQDTVRSYQLVTG